MKGDHVILFRSVVAAACAALLVWFIAQTLVLRDARAGLEQTLLLTTRAVETEVERLRALPEVASEDSRVKAALSGTGPIDLANRYLQTVAAQAGADELFLLDASGTTIAASNWNQQRSFVGHNYAFRPYFQDAMALGRGQFYAIGVTSGLPGFFLASRVVAGGTTGVLVVKLDLQPLQDTWRAADADVALADENGVVFLSARPDWQYRPLVALSPAVLAQLEKTRAYDNVALQQAVPLLAAPVDDSNAIGDGWIGGLSMMQDSGWQVIAARPTGPINLVATGWAVLAAFTTLAAAAVAKSFEQRRQITALRLSQSDRLEAMVVARTADLAREIDARILAEADLKATQEALIHTEKIAALGRMSVAIVHEISQPLAAMEATLAAAELSLSPDDTTTAPRLVTTRGLIRRMQRTIRHLKSFGSKQAGELSLIDLRAPVTSALDIVAPRSRAVGVTPQLQLPDKPVLVLAGAVRIEQVVVNLLLNALDAVCDSQGAQIIVRLDQGGDQVQLIVQDTGKGIAAADLSRVTEPFFSTKISGEGLGLGLSISKAILAEFHGQLDIMSDVGRGTQMTVCLPLAKAAKEAAA
jgi:two-component system, NtrC family, C4-dicarboxylate transport sensor histidine kinase DctB